VVLPIIIKFGPHINITIFIFTYSLLATASYKVLVDDIKLTLRTSFIITLFVTFAASCFSYNSWKDQFTKLFWPPPEQIDIFTSEWNRFLLNPVIEGNDESITRLNAELYELTRSGSVINEKADILRKANIVLAAIQQNSEERWKIVTKIYVNEEKIAIIAKMRLARMTSVCFKKECLD
jgi:hypothetical protein